MQTKHVPYAARAPWTLSPAPPSQVNWLERATQNGYGYWCLPMSRRKQWRGKGRKKNFTITNTKGMTRGGFFKGWLWGGRGASLSLGAGGGRRAGPTLLPQWSA